MSAFVRYEQSAAVVTLTLDRPESRNAIGSHQDCQDLVEALSRAQQDSSVSCLILTAAGTVFSAGGDLKAMKQRTGIGPQSTPEGTRANYRRGVQRVIRSFWDCELPMIAAINGPAIGLGLDLACLCDLRIAADSAKFASSFIKLGLVPGDGGAWILPRAIGLARAAELMLTGDGIDATQALSWGLVSRLVPAVDLMREAQTLAARVTANPARALRLVKRLLREGQQQGLNEMLELSAAFQALAHETADHREALDALLEKRPPRLTGC